MLTVNIGTSEFNVIAFKIHKKKREHVGVNTIKNVQDSYARADEGNQGDLKKQRHHMHMAWSQYRKNVN